MPIVIVDKDACLQSENKKVRHMMREFKRNPTHELVGEIQQKVRNNRQTNEKFCEDIDKKIERMKSYASTERADKKRRRQTTKIDLEENYEQVTSVERNQKVSRIKGACLTIERIMGDEENAR